MKPKLAVKILCSMIFFSYNQSFAKDKVAVSPDRKVFVLSSKTSNESVEYSQSSEDHEVVDLVISGTKTELDGLPLKADIVNRDWRKDAFGLAINLYGKEHFRVVGKYKSDWVLILPGKGVVKMYLNEAESAKRDYEVFAKTISNQKLILKAEELQKFNKNARIKMVELGFAKHSEAIKKSCGFSPKIKIDWASFEDKIFHKHQEASCPRAVEKAIKRACKDSKFQIDTVNCKAGPKVKVRLNGKELLVTQSPKTFEFDRRVQFFLENL